MRRAQRGRREPALHRIRVLGIRGVIAYSSDALAKAETPPSGVEA